MKCFFGRYFYVITFFLAFVLFWLFGDVIFFIVILAVIGEFLLLKSIYKVRFFIIDIIIFSVYLFCALLCLLFAIGITFKIFLVVIGIWMCLTIFFHKTY